MTIEIAIEPAQFLIDALKDKTPEQLISIINRSNSCDKISTVSIHMTALEVLSTQYPFAFKTYEESLNYPYGTDTNVD
ncbi:MAG: hypothetical protein JWO03_2856 [Bacteroidetes bacterium]|nr:hypothetical protein [Bacteroidota bacterium]